MPEVCSVQGCVEQVQIKKHGYCRSHYNKWYRTGSTSAHSDSQTVCAICGDSFMSQQPKAQYCGPECRIAANRDRAAGKYQRRSVTVETCKQCGSQFESRMASRLYCTKACARKASAERQTKHCASDGCTRPAKARNLCSTHYNRTLAGRHKKQATKCARCGEVVNKEPSRRYQLRFCDETCRDAYRSETARKRRKQVEPHKPRPLWHTAHHAYQPAKRTDRVFVSTKCIICGAMFLDLYGAKTCGDACGDIHRRGVRRDYEHRRRARKVAAFVAPVYRQRIFERDNFTCQLCLQPMAMDKRAPHPQSPSIDHVIALANGGTHEPNNVQAAHWLCNAIKGDREWVTTA